MNILVKEGICNFCGTKDYIVEEGLFNYCEKCYSDKWAGVCYKQKEGLDKDMLLINEKQFEELKDMSFKDNNGLDLTDKEKSGHVPSSFSVLQNLSKSSVEGKTSPVHHNLNNQEVKMAESQSRFSIIDSLTEKKINALKVIEDLKAQIELLKTQIVRTKEDTQRALDRKVEDLNQKIRETGERIKNETQVVKELDKGIIAIETVSKENKKE